MRPGHRVLALGPVLLVVLAALVEGVVLGQRAETAFSVYQVQWAQDLAFFNQIFHAAAAGGPWTSSLLLEPTGFFEMVHFHPIFVPLLPLYLLRPQATTLLWFNVAAVMAAAVPVFWLARDAARAQLPAGGVPAGFGLVAAISFLVWLPVQMAALADFRPMVFFVPGFLLLLAGVVGRSIWKTAAGVLICFAAREESAYLVSAVGASLLVLPLVGWRRRWGAALLAAGVGWFLFLLLFKANFFFHFNPLRLLEGGAESSPMDGDLLRERLRHVALLLTGGNLPMLLSPASLAMSAIPLGYLFSAPAKEWHAFTGTYAYYRDALLPFLVCGGVTGWAWLVRRLWAGRPALGFLTAAVVLVLGNGLAFRGERRRLEEGLWQPQREQVGSAEVLAIDGLLAQVPDEARVATDYRLIAALSGRRVLWNVAHLYMDGGSPPHWQTGWPLTLDRLDTVLVPMDDTFVGHLDSDWALAQTGGGYGLWRRMRAPEGGYPDDLP